MEDRVYTRQAAEILGKEMQTLAQWRSKGIGPTYYKDGKFVFYLRHDLEDYLKSRITRP